ncbi:hypothetical protein GX441_12395 [bacterium]|nr:hypothetical protein [bacterium]
MRTSRLFLITGVSVVFLFGLACGGKGFSVVESPKDSKVVSVENQKLVLTYHFTDPIKESSVILNSTLFVKTNISDSIQGSISFPDRQTLKFTSAQPVDSIFPNGEGEVIVRMVGSSPFKLWITDINDNPIDGNRDGDYGGDYRAAYAFRI